MWFFVSSIFFRMQRIRAKQAKLGTNKDKIDPQSHGEGKRPLKLNMFKQIIVRLENCRWNGGMKKG